jgi:hypothetical protein
MQVVDSTDDAAPVQPAIRDMAFFTNCVGNFMANLFDGADWTKQADCIRALLQSSFCPN